MSQRDAEQLVLREALLASGKGGGHEKLRLIFTDCLQVRNWEKLRVTFVHQ